jgi:hypothetical protein
MQIKKLVAIIAAEAVLLAMLSMPARANGGAPAPPDGSCGTTCRVVKCVLFAIYCLLGVADNVNVIGPSEQRDQKNYTVVYGKPEAA